MKLFTFGAASAALALCAFAGAQTPEAKPEQLGASLRLGFAIPVEDRASSSSNVFFAFGADYKLGYRAPSYGKAVGSINLSVDYYHKNDFGNIPVLLNFNLTKDSFTLSAGAGVGFGDEPGRSQTNFAYQGSLTYDVATDSNYPIFVQARFLGSDRSALNAVGVYVGIRF